MKSLRPRLRGARGWILKQFANLIHAQGFGILDGLNLVSGEISQGLVRRAEPGQGSTWGQEGCFIGQGEQLQLIPGYNHRPPLVGQPAQQARQPGSGARVQAHQGIFEEDQPLICDQLNGKIDALSVFRVQVSNPGAQEL